jgi:hypothetical protein
VTKLTPEAEEYLRHAKTVLVRALQMNRKERRERGFRAPLHHYQAQLSRVLRDLGEIV